MSTKISSLALFLLTFVVVITIVAAFAAITSITSIQPAAATTANNNTMRVDLVVDTTALKFQDVNNNTQPDTGEFAVVIGKLYAPGTRENETGTYRCFFPWGGWANSTEGTPLSLGMQVFDIKGNGTIVVVGDEPTTDSVDMPVAGAIAGGTGQFNGVSGMATLTAKPLEGTDFPLEVVFEFMQPPQTNTTTAGR